MVLPVHYCLLGALFTPDCQPLPDPLTLEQALAMAALALPDLPDGSRTTIAASLPSRCAIPDDNHHDSGG